MLLWTGTAGYYYHISLTRTSPSITQTNLLTSRTTHDTSVLDIAISKRCPISKPQAVPALSSDHNTIVFKIHLHPTTSKPRTQYDYKQANWPLFRATLDLHLKPKFPVHTTTDLERAITTFEMSVRQAAISAIPVQTVKRNHLPLPLNFCTLLKLKNHYRRRYQRSRLPSYYHLYLLFPQVISTQLSRLRNMKWTSFLRTLHPQSSQFWKIARYFKNPTSSVTPPRPRPRPIRGRKFFTLRSKLRY
jgi:hypothetical protein